MKLKLLSLFLLVPLVSICQNIMVTVSPNPLIATKYENEKLIIPIEVDLLLIPGSVPATGGAVFLFNASLSTAGLPPSLGLSATEFNMVSLQRSVDSIKFYPDTVSRKVRLYVILPADLLIVSNKALLLEILLNHAIVTTKQLTIQPSSDRTYATREYLMPNVRLDEVTNVASNNNILTVSGFVNNGFTKRQVLLEKYEALAIWDYTYLMKPGYLSSSPFSLVSVPFKIRPKVKTLLTKRAPTDTSFAANAASGISNLGINMDIIKWTLDRYFANGKKSTHKLGIGVFLAPGVEELSAGVIKDTSLVGDRKSKQMYLSMGISAFYSYNGITFFVAPAAFDWAPSGIGAQWIYNKKYWWGFGIGVSPTILSQLLNK